MPDPFSQLRYQGDPNEDIWVNFAKANLKQFRTKAGKFSFNIDKDTVEVIGGWMRDLLLDHYEEEHGDSLWESSGTMLRAIEDSEVQEVNYIDNISQIVLKLPDYRRDERGNGRDDNWSEKLQLNTGYGPITYVGRDEITSKHVMVYYDGDGNLVFTHHVPASSAEPILTINQDEADVIKERLLSYFAGM